MQANPILGVAIHSVGAFSASSCYTPQKKTTLWAWEVYWIAQATVAWLILPITVALLTVPDYFAVLRDCPPSAMRNSFLLGMLYGFGGMSFGLGIRYIGFSLNYTIAIGLSAALGTLLPLIWDPTDGFVWVIAETFNTVPGLIVLLGIVLSLVGIAICGRAGVLREKMSGEAVAKYSFRIGVPLAVFAGVLSAVFNFALLAGKPLEEAAHAAGASELLQMNAIYPFSNGGAWVTNFVLSIILIARNRTGGQFLRLPGNSSASLKFYYLMALLSGAFWYFQFFFYGMGHAHMGEEYGFTSWALHMPMLILFSNFYGYLFKEWEGTTTKPKSVLHAGMAVIVVSMLIITLGNYLAPKPHFKDKQIETWANAVADLDEMMRLQALATPEDHAANLSALGLVGPTEPLAVWEELEPLLREKTPEPAQFQEMRDLAGNLRALAGMLDADEEDGWKDVQEQLEELQKEIIQWQNPEGDP